MNFNMANHINHIGYVETKPLLGEKCPFTPELPMSALSDAMSEAEKILCAGSRQWPWGIVRGLFNEEFIFERIILSLEDTRQNILTWHQVLKPVIYKGKLITCKVKVINNYFPGLSGGIISFKICENIV
jgi:hypothetical protein